MNIMSVIYILCSQTLIGTESATLTTQIFWETPLDIPLWQNMIIPVMQLNQFILQVTQW